MAIAMHIIAIWRPPLFLGFNYDAQMHRPIQIQRFRNLRIRQPRYPLTCEYFGVWWTFTSIFGHIFIAYAQLLHSSFWLKFLRR